MTLVVMYGVKGMHNLAQPPPAGFDTEYWLVEAATLGCLAFVMFISAITASLYVGSMRATSSLFGLLSTTPAGPGGGYVAFVVFTWFSLIAIAASSAGAFLKSRQEASGAPRPGRRRAADDADAEANAAMAAASDMGMEVEGDLAALRRKSQKVQNSTTEIGSNGGGGASELPSYDNVVADLKGDDDAGTLPAMAAAKGDGGTSTSDCDSSSVDGGQQQISGDDSDGGGPDDYLKPGKAIPGDPTQQCAYSNDGRSCRFQQSESPGMHCEKHSCPNCASPKRSSDVACSDCQ